MTPPKPPTHFDSDLPPEPLSEDTPPEPAELAAPPEPDDVVGPPEPEPPVAPASTRAPASPPLPVSAPPPPAPARAAPAAAPVKAAPVAPVATAPVPVQGQPPARADARERQRAALAAEIHNPRGASSKAVVVPAAVLLLLLAGGGLLVHVWASAEDASRTTIEEVKTPQQKRLEQERALQEVMPTSTAAELAELTPEPSAAEATTGTQAVAPASSPPRPRRSLAPTETQLRREQTAPTETQFQREQTAPTETQLAAGQAPPPARRSLATSMAVGFADAAPSTTTPPTVQRGTFLPACLTSGADPSHPAPFTATVSADVLAGEAVAVPRNAALVCTAQGLTASRLSGSCDTLTIPGRGSLTFSGVVYGRDRRPGLPVVITGGPNAGDDAADSAVATAERVLGAVSPGGLGGELLQGAAGTGGRAARSARRSPEASARPVPPGTCFLVFVDQPF